jgi:Bacterial Ig domain
MSGRASRKRFVGAGAAGAAAVFAVLPFAQADPVGTQTSATPSVPPAGNEAGQPPSSVTPQGVVTPDFGFQKIRVGVQIADGSWVPPGTDTGGSDVSIVETGPNATFAAAVNGTSCTTQVGSEDPGSTETYCFFHQQQPSARIRAQIAASGLALPAASPSLSNDYLAFPGDTVTFTQTSVQPHLVIDSNPQVVGPCVTTQPETGGGTYPTCPSQDQFNDVVFNDPGLPPKAINDDATVVSGHSVIIKVLKNDVTHGAPAKINSATRPAHGKALIVVGQSVGSEGAAAAAVPSDPFYEIQYKSFAPYVGPDKFQYTMSTPNGRSTATVFITVIAPPPIAVNDSARTQVDTAVTIDVLSNDNARGGGALSVQSVGTPQHGTATISNGKVVYTPDAGFSGRDSFEYTAATQFGTDTAVVTVTIPAPLAATGSSSHNLADIGVLLLITGGAATVAGRRRYRAKHAGFH